MVLLIDNYDSFSWNLHDYALRCGMDCRLFRNDEISLEEIKVLKPSGIILSPGPQEPQHHPLLMDVIAQFHRETPILGVCLGHQAIGQYFGSRLRRGPEPVHGKVHDVQHAGHRMFEGISSPFRATRYHSLVLDKVNSDELEITAWTAEGVPMAIAHRSLPVWGVQYHPEAWLTEGGLRLLANWHAQMQQS